MKIYITGKYNSCIVQIIFKTISICMHVEQSRNLQKMLGVISEQWDFESYILFVLHSFLTDILNDYFYNQRKSKFR